MSDPFDDDDQSYWTPYADFLAGVAMIFLVASILMLLHLNDPKQKSKEGEIKSPGTVMVEMFWKPDADVDLWVKSPDDKPVGYSRKQGKYFDLLRDDLGGLREKVGGNHHENAFSRTAPPGEYVINIHMYSVRSNQIQFPLEVELAVQIVKIQEDGSPIQKVIKIKIPLNQVGEEVTAVRFVLDEQANLIPRSINHDQIPLREAKK